MKHTVFGLIALALAAGAPALGQVVDIVPPPRPLPYVVVDPDDLRKPVPDPEGALTEKYDGKLVRFAGVVRRVTQDKKTKKARFEMHHDIVQMARVKGKKGPVVVSKEAIIVPVTFRAEEVVAERQIDKLLRTRKTPLVLTVEGRASIMVDGTLVISEAIVAPDAPTALPRK